MTTKLRPDQLHDAHEHQHERCKWNERGGFQVARERRLLRQNIAALGGTLREIQLPRALGSWVHKILAPDLKSTFRVSDSQRTVKGGLA
jgi:hypothetical protein